MDENKEKQKPKKKVKIKKQIIADWHIEQSKLKTYTRSEYRLIIAEKVILEGSYSRKTVKEFCGIWGIKKRMVERLFSAARERIKKAWEKERESYKDVILSRYEEIYYSCKKEKDYKNMISVLKEMSYILGINNKSLSIDVNHSLSKESPNEIAKKLLNEKVINEIQTDQISE